LQSRGEGGSQSRFVMNRAVYRVGVPSAKDRFVENFRNGNARCNTSPRYRTSPVIRKETIKQERLNFFIDRIKRTKKLTKIRITNWVAKQ